MLESKSAVLPAVWEAWNEVVASMGFSHSEAMYQRALQVALHGRGIPVRSEVPCPIWFRNKCVGVGRADLVVPGYVLELKAAGGGRRRDRCRDPEEQVREYVRSLKQSEGINVEGVVLRVSDKMKDCSVGQEDAVMFRAGKASAPPTVKKSPAPGDASGVSEADIARICNAVYRRMRVAVAERLTMRRRLVEKVAQCALGGADKSSKVARERDAKAVAKFLSTFFRSYMRSFNGRREMMCVVRDPAAVRELARTCV